MTSKSDGTYSAAYAYRYGDKLYSVTSDFPAEGDATYQYDGAGKRRQRAAGGGATKYRWDIGLNVLNEEDSGGSLTRTYVGRSAAHVDGANPSTGAWRFYVHDHLGSTRGVYDANKTPYAAFEHTPYGELYASSGSTSDITRRYTGHDWDDAAQFYYAPYRYYAPGLARWITRDPLGMVDGPNVYGYVGGNPIARVDSLGLIWSWPAIIVGGISGGACGFGYGLYQCGKTGDASEITKKTLVGGCAGLGGGFVLGVITGDPTVPFIVAIVGAGTSGFISGLLGGVLEHAWENYCKIEKVLATCFHGPDGKPLKFVFMH